MTAYKIKNLLTGRDVANQRTNGTISDKPMLFRTKAGAVMFIEKYSLSHFYQIEEIETNEKPNSIYYYFKFEFGGIAI